MSETFIKEFNFSEDDMSICDALIEYHKHNLEYKNIGKPTTNHVSLDPKRKTLPRLR